MKSAKTRIKNPSRGSKTFDNVVNQTSQTSRHRSSQRTERYKAKQERLAITKPAKYGAKRGSAKTKTIARSSAMAASSTSGSIAGTESVKAQAKASSDIAKYNALVNGNVYGENGVDKDKDGGQGNSNPEINPGNNYYTGVFN